MTQFASHCWGQNSWAYLHQAKVDQPWLGKKYCPAEICRGVSKPSNLSLLAPTFCCFPQVASPLPGPRLAFWFSVCYRLCLNIISSSRISAWFGLALAPRPKLLPTSQHLPQSCSDAWLACSGLSSDCPSQPHSLYPKPA